MSTDHANAVILACYVLHNFMRTKSPQTYTPPGYADCLDPSGDIVDGAWRQEQQPIPQRNVPIRPPKSATDVRNELELYFSGPGALPWQDAHVRRTGNNRN